MKIAVLASRSGTTALHIHEFFKEGNRIAVDTLITDFPESEVASKLASDGVKVVPLTPETDFEGLARSLKQRDVELLVVDDFEGEIPQPLVQAFANAVVTPSCTDKACLEVIEAAENITIGPAKKAAAHRPVPSDRPLTPEEEWADVLKVEFDEEEAARRAAEAATPPVFPGVQPPVFNETEEVEVKSEQPERKQEPVQPQPPVYPGPEPAPYVNQPAPQQPRIQTEEAREPMPPTYLIWSVIITIVCCLIPGIVAIIFSASVSSKYFAGDIEGAKRASRNAQIWCIVSIVTGIVWATLYTPLMLLFG